MFSFPVPRLPVNLIPLASVLAERFRSEGWAEGAPFQGAEETDAEAYREMICPRCRRIGLSFRPFHKGDRYRGLACCACGFGEEV